MGSQKKKIGNHAAAVAIWSVDYNFCRLHQTLRMTPAMESGISNQVWTIEELCGLLPESASATKRIDKGYPKSTRTTSRVAMKYKVFFHRGDELTLKTRVIKGYARLDDFGLHIEGSGGFDIPLDELRGAELFRLHGLGRVIRLEHRQGRLFLAVARLMIGQFALINFFKTGALHEDLVAIAARKS
jgi:hypothetical protein